MRLTELPMAAIYLGGMVKRQMKDAGLPGRPSPHSFRVATITHLLTQGCRWKTSSTWAGHADPRTTRLYDRRQKRVTRNVVERISIYIDDHRNPGNDAPADPITGSSRGSQSRGSIPFPT